MTGPDAFEGWEFRLSPDRRHFAFYDPGNGPWFVPNPAMQGRFVDSDKMDSLGWQRFTPESRAADRITALRWAADFAEGVAERLREHHEFERANGAMDVMAELRRLIEKELDGSDGPRCVCGDPIQLMFEDDPASWIHRPGSDTRCLDARPF